MPPESQSEAIVISQSYVTLGGREVVRDRSATSEANLMKASRCVATFAMAMLAACTQVVKGDTDPSRVLLAPSPWPTPEVLAPNAPPRILALWMNETTIHVGRVWNGRIITSTNVASVELRTESFSFVADRLGFGIFHFSQTVLDIIPQYRRAYILRVIARNARGDSAERLVRIVIR
jgi:hypothetical protein